MQSARPSPSRSLVGSSRNPQVLAELRTAQAQGFLLCDTRDRREAIMKYTGWAQRFGVPWVLVHYGQSARAKYVHVEIDSPANNDCPYCLNAMRALLAEHNHGPRFCSNPGYAYAARVDKAHAVVVAARAATLALRAFHCKKGSTR